MTTSDDWEWEFRPPAAQVFEDLEPRVRDRIVDKLDTIVILRKYVIRILGTVSFRFEMFCDARFEVGVDKKRPAHLCVWRIDILWSIDFGFDLSHNPSPFVFECLELRWIVVVVQKRGIDLGDVEVESLGHLAWFESPSLDSLDDRQNGNAPSLNVGFVEDVLCDPGFLL